MLLYSPNIHRCEHIKVNGTQCGSPSLRRNRFCYFHARWHEQHITFATSAKTVPAIDLPVLEDANSIQVAIMQVIGLLLTGHIEHKTAGLILYGLQTASCNLRHTKFEAEPQSVVVDPASVGETLMDSLLWDNSHFPDEEDSEEEDQEEDSDNDSSETNVGNPLLLTHSTETDSTEEDSTETDSPKTNSKGRPQPQENDWSDLRNQIATLVKNSSPNGVLDMTTDTAGRST